jgi:hypothetical protein
MNEYSEEEGNEGTATVEEVIGIELWEAAEFMRAADENLAYIDTPRTEVQGENLMTAIPDDYYETLAAFEDL